MCPQSDLCSHVHMYVCMCQRWDSGRSGVRSVGRSLDRVSFGSQHWREALQYMQKKNKLYTSMYINKATAAKTTTTGSITTNGKYA